MFTAISPSTGISPFFAIAQLISIGVVVAFFLFIKRSHGYSGVLFVMSVIGSLFAGYHGIDRLDNYESADDIAGAILLGIGIFALSGLGIYARTYATKKE